ncbi:activator-dependent family glycosyltransferase [Streptosporangium sp. NPDC005286]|uniref:activator-dependent family glycosyltransferase n=1 Tax=Streptosporangium sp. NPDC005286 TaxID=3154463 RepID=UPI0033AA00B6
MRVLFATIPEKTIFLPSVPLAWALRTAGHEVRVASQPKFADVITQAGLTAAPVGRDADFWWDVKLDPKLLEQARAGLPMPWKVAEDRTDVTWESLLDAYGGTVPHEQKPHNFPLIAGMVDFARHWRPDLVIWEPFTSAGAIAAKACGAAHARLLWSVDVFGVTREHFLRLQAEQPPEERADPLADWLAGYGRKYGFDFTEDMITGNFTIHQFPTSIGVEADLHYLRTRYVPYGGPAVVPKWLWTPPRRPRVALTLGTTATEHFGGYAANVQDILDALADLDIEVVATIAESEQAKLRRVPDNARLVSYVPLHALVPTCTAVIHHGGAGTLSTVALHGIPQLALPYHFEGPLISRRLAEHGAGLAIPSALGTGPAVRKALLRLLNDPVFRDRATGLRNEVRALPTPNELVPQLEELTAKYRSRETP